MSLQCSEKIYKSLRLLLWSVCVVLLVQGCKGVKSRNSAFERVAVDEEEKEYNFRQNFTTKYNILYNANLMLDAEEEAIFQSASKNFQIRQTVFDEPTGDGDPHRLMDSLIQKAYKIVNDKQESKYVNEAFLIIGRANYLKGNYHNAIEFFNHLLRSAEEQKEYLPRAYAWKSRALLQIGKSEEAGWMIDSAYMALDGSRDTRTFVNAAKANHLLRIGQELEAIPYLEYALESNKRTLNKYRWRFLLAQLYKDNGQFDKAAQYFGVISKSNVPYDMAFEASLQQSLLAGSKYARVADQVKPLLRMLREGKNDGYQDQILFHVGEIYARHDDMDKALSYFKQSLAQPNRNNYQATEAYLRLADYFFDEKQYVVAQNYYDSAAMVLPPDYTDVNKVRRKLGYMGEITQLYADVVRKDTLLYLAALNEEGRNERVSLYASERLQAKQAQLEHEAKIAKKGRGRAPVTEGQAGRTLNMHSLNQQEDIAAVGTDRAFYFNNPDELLLGQSAFKRRWGNRQPKDNWRYEADNSQMLTSNTTQTTAAAKDDEREEFDRDAYFNRIRESYLSEVPLTKGALDSVHRAIHDNLIMIGNIYRDYTQTSTDAIAVYEEFLKRYPNTPAGAEIYYSLYRMYSDIDQGKSNEYKARLMALFPNSLHAKVAEDPAYMDKYRRDKNILDRLFERLFGMYAAGDHAAVIQEADRELQNRFENTALVAQVEYLRALAIGRVGRVEDFVDALELITQKFPNDSLVTPLAYENMAFIEKNPNMFINRVNALQDVDRGRMTFVDEPDMTPWPALRIYGDYRSGTALAVAEPELPVEPEEEVVAVKEEEKVEEEVVATVEEVQEEIVAVVEKGSLAENAEENIVVELAEKQAEAKADDKEQQVALVEKAEEIDTEEHTEEAERKVLTLSQTEEKVNLTANTELSTGAVVQGKDIAIAAAKIDFGPNHFRDMSLFPEEGEYFFTINVMDDKVNMAPSRYGIGQFIRTRYQNMAINHQLKVVNGENQLIFIGPFKTFDQAKTYEARILPMMPEIMKVPDEIYNTFIILKEVIPSLTDGVTIKQYHQNYLEQ